MKTNIVAPKLYQDCVNYIIFSSSFYISVSLLVSLLNSWSKWDYLVADKNYMGHTFRVVARRYFPYVYFSQDRKPLDSLDIRILDVISRKHNFS